MIIIFIIINIIIRMRCGNDCLKGWVFSLYKESQLRHCRCWVFRRTIPNLWTGYQESPTADFVEFEGGVTRSWSSGALCVVGSTLAFGSIGLGFKSRTPPFFHIILNQPSATRYNWCCAHWIWLSSLFAVIHSASYPSGKANRVTANQW